MSLKKDDHNLSDFFSDGVDLDPLPVKKNPFAKLEDKFGIASNTTKKPPTKKDSKVIKDAVKEGILETKELINDEAFEDKEYIRSKIKSVIEKLDEQLYNLESSLGIGAEPRMFETYSTMAKTMVDSIGKLMELQKQVSTTFNTQALGMGGNKLILEEKVTRKITSANFNDFIDELGAEVEEVLVDEESDD